MQEKTLDENHSGQEVSLCRKLATWALCLIVLAKENHLNELPEDLQKELARFRE